MRRWLGSAFGAGALTLVAGLITLQAEGSNLLTELLAIVAFVSPSVVGVYLVWRGSDNSIGLILSGFGFSFLP